jgi:hypothetical protein
MAVAALHVRTLLTDLIDRVVVGYKWSKPPRQRRRPAENDPSLHCLLATTNDRIGIMPSAN